MDTPRPAARLQSAALLEVGQEALARGAWEEARSAFERALQVGNGTVASDPSRTDPAACAEILSGLADALWWLGDIRDALDCWERAYSGFCQRSDPVQATLAAIWLSLVYDANIGNHAAAAGWAARAARHGLL
jgi:tetratricopeptide (TPR) repeat protein